MDAVFSANGGALSFPRGSEAGSDCRRRADRCGPEKRRLARLPPWMYAVLHRSVCDQSTRCVAVETRPDEAGKRLSSAVGGGEGPSARVVGASLAGIPRE